MAGSELYSPAIGSMASATDKHDTTSVHLWPRVRFRMACTGFDGSSSSSKEGTRYTEAVQLMGNDV